ncbi:MAG: hypothetical protein ABMA01_17925 [Chthoniobacteraceae bacterium]
MKKAAIPIKATKNAIAQAILRKFSFEGGELDEVPADIAEDRAKMHDGSATYYEEQGRTDLADGQRKIAAWWRSLGSLPADSAEKFCDDFHLKCGEAIDGLLALARESDEPFLYLVLLANHILAGLLDLAVPGRHKAAIALMGAIGETVSNFELLATRKPELFRKWARGCLAIPGLISCHPDQARENVRLLESLEQGQETYLAKLATGKRTWNFEGPNLLAVRLIGHIESSNLFYESDKGLSGKGYPELPAWRKAATRLKRFSARTWPSWANIAWEVLAEVSPSRDPSRHPALKKFFAVRRSRKNPYYGDVVDRARSIRTNDWKEALRGAFELVGTGRSRRNKQAEEAVKKRGPKAAKPA